LVSKYKYLMDVLFDMSNVEWEYLHGHTAIKREGEKPIKTKIGGYFKVKFEGDVNFKRYTTKELADRLNIPWNTIE